MFSVNIIHLREFLGHNSVSGLCTLKPEKPKNLQKILKTVFFSLSPTVCINDLLTSQVII